MCNLYITLNIYCLFRPEPMQVTGIVPTTMNATLVTDSICSSSGDSSNSNHSFSFRPLQTLMDDSKSNSQ